MRPDLLQGDNGEEAVPEVQQHPRADVRSIVGRGGARKPDPSRREGPERPEVLGRKGREPLQAGAVPDNWHSFSIIVEILFC